MRDKNKKIIISIALICFVIIGFNNFIIKASVTDVSQPTSESPYTQKIYNNVPSESVEAVTPSTNDSSQIIDNQTKKYDVVVTTTLPEVRIFDCPDYLTGK